MKMFVTLCLFILTTTKAVHATTWDEPWQDKILKESQSMVLAKVTSCDVEKGVTLQLLKMISGVPVPETFTINQFSLLHLCSYSSGEEPEFRFQQIDSCYFFLTKNDSGGYSISTPTSGFAVLRNGKVFATYRHSYHQASVDKEVYEKTMLAMFNHYHNTAYDTGYINNFIALQLAKKPAHLVDEEVADFFNQHVALELIYHLQLPGYYQRIIPFLHLDNFHAQISAARALTWYNSAETHTELYAIISDTTTRDFVKVMAAWALQIQHPQELKSKLAALEKTASTDADGFGGNIMDPRVCTKVPSVKTAITELADSL